MVKYFQQFRLTRRTKGFYVLLVIMLLALCLPVGGAQAHGGAIIKDGYTDKYEWLVAINPYPTPPGQIVLTLLVYSLETHKAVTDLKAELYLAPPDSSTPCCEKGKSLGPFPLSTDPTQFPGDYSTPLTLDKTGAWQAKFHVTDKSGTFDVIVPLAVTPGNSTQATIDAVMAQVASGQIAVTPQPQSPLSMTLNGQPASPLVVSNAVSPTTSVANNNVLGGQSAPLSASQPNPFGRFWWLWGLFAMLPIAAIFVWGLRPV